MKFFVLRELEWWIRHYRRNIPPIDHTIALINRKKKCAKTCWQGSSRSTRSLDCVWSLVGMCMFVCTVQACNILTCNNYSRYQQDKNNSGDSKIGICRLLTCFRSGLPWSVDCNFDGFCIGGDLRWACRYRYGDWETFTYFRMRERKRSKQKIIWIVICFGYFWRPVYLIMNTG